MNLLRKRYYSQLLERLRAEEYELFQDIRGRWSLRFKKDYWNICLECGCAFDKIHFNCADVDVEEWRALQKIQQKLNLS